MRLLFLLISLSSCYLAIGQNRITIKAVDGKLESVCSINNIDTVCSVINTKQDILIVPDPSLPTNPKIVVTDLKGKQTPFHKDNAAIINGSEDPTVAYNITITFSNYDPLTITGVGSDKKTQTNLEQEKKSTVADGNCGCHSQNTAARVSLNAAIKKVEEEITKANDAEKDALIKKRADLERKLTAMDKAPWNTDIVNALDLCPDCGDENFIVYDAHCKSLYKRIDKNSFSRITDLREVL